MNRTIIIAILFIGILSCDKSTKIEDVVIIGGGLMGSSTGWELSKNGEKVLLIERQDSIYTFGSSFGEARISRSLGAKNDIFSYLQRTSVAETKKLIEYLNESENGNRHSMDDVYTSSPVTYIRYKSQEEEVRQLLEEQEDKYEYFIIGTYCACSKSYRDVPRIPIFLYFSSGVLFAYVSLIIQSTSSTE